MASALNLASCARYSAGIESSTRDSKSSSMEERSRLIVRLAASLPAGTVMLPE